MNKVVVGCVVGLGLLGMTAAAQADGSGLGVGVKAGTLGLGFANASIFPTMLNLAERRLIITGNVTSWFFVGGSSSTGAPRGIETLKTETWPA